MNRGLFFKAALSSPNVEKCDQNGSAWVRVPYGSQNCPWLQKFNFGDSRQVRNLSRRGLFFKAALSSPNIEKCDQNGSAWVMVPLGSQNCPWLQKFSFGNSRQVRTCREEAFFSKLLCLARISRNVTKMGHNGSGSSRPPKTAPGCKSLILAIHDRSVPVEKRPFFRGYSA